MTDATFGHAHPLTGELAELWGNPHQHDHPGGDQSHNHGWGVLASAQGPVDMSKFPQEVVVTDPRDAKIAELSAAVEKLLALTGQAPAPAEAPAPAPAPAEAPAEAPAVDPSELAAFQAWKASQAQS